MKKLTLEQEDALIEIGNIGMSKAAKQLSILLHSPIKITIPKISFLNIDEITKESIFENEQIYSFVSQMISSDIKGCAALVFQREHTNLLTMAIIGKIPEFTQEEVRVCEHEAMLEIGNIIITSCLSVIANMLSRKINLSLPTYSENKPIPLLKNLCLSISKLSKDFIAITTTLDTFNDKLSGHLFIILTEDSADVFLEQIGKLIDG